MTIVRPETVAHPVERAVGASTRKKRLEAAAAIVSLLVIVLLAAVDVVHGAPADRPVVQAPVAEAPAAATMPPAGDSDTRWAADESAGGARPDNAH